MTTIKLSVQKTSISAIVDGKLTSGTVGVEVLIDYDSSWDELTKTATFRVGNFARSRENIGTATTVPWEVMRHPGKVLMVGVEGKDIDGNIVMPTVWASVGTIQSGANATIPGAPNPETGETPSASGATIDDSIVSKSKTWSSHKISEEIDNEARNVLEKLNDKADAIVVNVSGETIFVSDSSDDKIRNLKIFGKTTQDGTPSPDNPVELVSVGDSGAIEIAISAEEDPQKAFQSFTVSTPNGLPGIPVSGGGNYTDAEGQQWICDEIDFARGVYVQRVKPLVLDQTTSFSISGNGLYFITDVADRMPASPMLCDKLLHSNGLDNATTPGWWADNTTNKLIALAGFVSSGLVTTVTELKAYLAENPLTTLYILEKPVEKPLQNEEIAAFKALHTNYPSTTVCNDACAYMELAYNADTKTYIDNKFTELQNAILATGANV